MAEEKLESQKAELTLSINNFNQPTEVVDVEAYTRLVTNLLFMVPGTLPSLPEAGINIQKYDYVNIDDVEDEIVETITEQIDTYLPDIPLESVELDTSGIESGNGILAIILLFTMPNGETSQSVVATAKHSKSIIDFEVAI